MKYEPPTEEPVLPPGGKDAIDDVRKAIVEEADHAFDDIISDTNDAFKSFQGQLDALQKAIKDLGPGDQAAKINELSKQMQDWLKSSNDRWSNLGTKLGDIVQKGIKAWVGL